MRLNVKGQRRLADNHAVNRSGEVGRFEMENLSSPLGYGGRSASDSTPSMKEPFVAVVVSIPEEHFSDDDDICLAAGNFLCAKLETHLTQNGHSIPDWIHGGCNEDWGVYFESKLNGTSYEYHICFFPAPNDTTQNQMLIQYHVRLPFLKRLFRKPVELLPDDPMHETMQSFGQMFGTSRSLSKSQLKNEY